MTRSLDHVVHVVTDLDRAADEYAGLGFTVTPRADHPFGTSNRLVVLTGVYIEMVAVTAADRLPETGFGAQVARHVADRGPGLSHVVLRSDDPALDLQDLGDRAAGGVFTFSRPAPLLAGRTMEARFSCIFTTGAGVFLCHHHTPEAVWDPPAMKHANGASSIEALAVIADDEAAGHVAAVAGAPMMPLMAGSTELRRSRIATVWTDGIHPPAFIEGVNVLGH
jgi:hypothetical protein